MSAIVRPLFLRTRWLAGMGAVSISIGLSPQTSKPAKRARALQPSRDAMRSLISSSAEAPSVIWEEFPAVMCQPTSGKRAASSSVRKAGFKVARLAGEVSGRMVSSTSTTPRGVTIGRISRRNAPCSRANWARRWDSAE
ncbi:hypothetical protein D3C86_1156910 [compost metagenome]